MSASGYLSPSSPGYGSRTEPLGRTGSVSFGMQSVMRGAGAAAPQMREKPQPDPNAFRDAVRRVDAKLQANEVSNMNEVDLFTRLNSTVQVDEPIFRRQFLEKQIVTLPDSLVEQYNQQHYKCFMGLFPEINRAWISVDNRLTLWRYVGSPDIVQFDELDQIIITAGLVRPRPGVFVETIQYLLVLATPVEIVLLGISLPDGPSGDLRLFPTQLSVPSDNVNILKIAGTDSGRVFMAGKDGNLYELLYQAEDTWFSRKCRKLNRTQSAFSTYLPSFLRFDTDRPIVDLAVDSQCNTLYTLQENSQIQLFYLGEAGDAMVDVYKSEVLYRMQYLIRREEDFGTVVSLHVIPLTESRKISLMAVTSTGVRLFFGTTMRHSERDPANAPTTLDLVKTIPAQQAVKGVHAAFYNNGVALMAAEVTPGANDVLLTVSNPGYMITQQHRGPPEVATTGPEPRGKMWSLSEIPLPAPLVTRPDTTDNPRKLPLRGTNELLVQHMTPARQFICLANNGLHVIERRRPMDMLHALLLEAGGSLTPDLERFFQMYHRDEGCAMCVTLACANAHALSRIVAPNAYPLSPPGRGIMPAPVRTEDVAPLAIRAFFQYGGQPEMIETAQEMIFSGVHNGLYLYFARIVEPIWRRTVLQLQTPATRAKGNVPRQWNFRKDELQTIEEFLRALTRLFADPLFQSYIGQGFSQPRSQAPLRHRVVDLLQNLPNAIKTEQVSVAHLTHVVDRCLEATAFLQVLVSQDWETLIRDLFIMENEKKLSVEERMSGITFSELISNVDGRGDRVARELVGLHMKKLTKPQVAILSDSLRERCPTFFSPDDTLVQQANALLRAARIAPAPLERVEQLTESLKLYTKAIKSLEIEQVAEEYLKLRFYSGAVDLCLAKAKRLDPQNLATDWYTHQSGNAAEPIKEFKDRMECYGWILSGIQELSEPVMPSMLDERPSMSEEERVKLRAQCLKRALESDDLLFHHAMYDWFVQNNRGRELVEFRSPFVESFLLRSDAHIDLLWQYYINAGVSDKAALLLTRLAERDSRDLRLETRVDYLSRAISAAKSMDVGQGGVIDSEFLRQLEEKMEIAAIQLHIQRELFTSQNAERQEVARKLDERLYDVSDLYNSFATVYGLWEVCLEIIKTCGHDDHRLVETIWQRLIREDVKRDQGHEFEMQALMIRLTRLIRQYYPSEQILPMEFLVAELENEAFQMRVRRVHATVRVWKVFVDAGVSCGVLFQSYRKALASETFKHPEARLHIFQSFCDLVEYWINVVLAPGAPSSETSTFNVNAVETSLNDVAATAAAMDRSQGSEQLREKTEYLKERLMQTKNVARMSTARRPFGGF